MLHVWLYLGFVCVNVCNVSTLMDMLFKFAFFPLSLSFPPKTAWNLTLRNLGRGRNSAAGNYFKIYWGKTFFWWSLSGYTQHTSFQTFFPLVDWVSSKINLLTTNRQLHRVWRWMRPSSSSSIAYDGGLPPLCSFK